MILIEEVIAGQVWSTHIALWMNLDRMTNAVGEVLLELATVTVVVYGLFISPSWQEIFLQQRKLILIFQVCLVTPEWI